MLTKTRGIVFNYIKYKETSIIVRIFTRELGLQSYIVNSVRTKGKTNKITFYQPLSILDLVVYSNVKTELHRISEAQFAVRYSTIPFDILKSSITLFLSETISKMMLEQEKNEALYDFLEASLSQFDELKSNYYEFHLFILINLMDFLGHSIPLLNSDLTEKQLEEIKKNTCLTGINRQTRSHLLNYILTFYKEHSQLNLNLKSLAVLEAIFD